MPEADGTRLCNLAGNADLLIVKTAVETAKGKHTTLVGDDTDLIVLLCYYYSVTSCDLVFKPEPKANARRRVWAMKRVKTKLGEDVCANIFFIHALLGCDTNSRIFGNGKGAALKKFPNSSTAHTSGSKPQYSVVLDLLMTL